MRGRLGVLELDREEVELRVDVDHEAVQLIDPFPSLVAEVLEPVDQTRDQRAPIALSAPLPVEGESELRREVTRILVGHPDPDEPVRGLEVLEDVAVLGSVHGT